MEESLLSSFLAVECKRISLSDGLLAGVAWIGTEPESPSDGTILTSLSLLCSGGTTRTPLSVLDLSPLDDGADSSIIFTSLSLATLKSRSLPSATSRTSLSLLLRGDGDLEPASFFLLLGLSEGGCAPMST